MKGQPKIMIKKKIKIKNQGVAPRQPLNLNLLLNLTLAAQQPT